MRAPGPFYLTAFLAVMFAAIGGFSATLGDWRGVLVSVPFAIICAFAASALYGDRR